MVRSRSFVLAGGLHLALAGVFQYLGLFPFVVVNVLAAPVYVWLLLLNWRGQGIRAAAFAHTAELVSLLGAAVMLGPHSGFEYFFFPLAMAPLVVFPPGRVLLQTTFAVLAVVAFVVADLGVWPESVSLALDAGPRVVLHRVNVAGGFGTLMALTVFFYQGVVRSDQALREEKLRSWGLLLNVLPGRIAKRLLEDKETIADAHGGVTVLFADLAGFTALSRERDAIEVVTLLNRIFSRFDTLCERHGVEKIKTMGDGYMAAGGLPGTADRHAAAVSRLALSMHVALQQVCSEAGVQLHLRIGMATGPVVAGVVGRRRFRYDLWGDTVNLAHALEASGAPGRIQVSDDLRRALGDAFVFEERDTVDLAGRGSTRSWWLSGERPVVEAVG